MNELNDGWMDGWMRFFSLIFSQGDEEHVNNHPEEGGSQQPAESSGGSSPDNTLTREEEKNDEVTNIEGQDGEENNTNPDVNDSIVIYL